MNESLQVILFMLENDSPKTFLPNIRLEFDTSCFPNRRLA